MDQGIQKISSISFSMDFKAFGYFGAVDVLP